MLLGWFLVAACSSSEPPRRTQPAPAAPAPEEDAPIVLKGTKTDAAAPAPDATREARIRALETKARTEHPPARDRARIAAEAEIERAKAGRVRFQQVLKPLAPGQWVLRKSVTGDSTSPSAKVTYTYNWVEASEPGTLLLRTQTLDADLQHAIGVTFDQTRQVSPARPLGVGFGYMETCVIGDHTVSCCRRDGGESVTWLSNEVPIMGVVKLVRYDANGVEISYSAVLDFGETGGAEKPLR